MSNQILLWGLFIVPWLTLILMTKEDIKRYMPAGLLTIVLCVITTEIGISNGWWYIRETTYPLAVMPTYTYGAFPVTTMWSLKYLFGRFQYYLVAEVFLNTFFATIYTPWIARRGIKDFDAGLILFFFASAMGLILYGYQMWQEGIFARAERTGFSQLLQPTAAKPLPKEQQDNSKKEN